MLVTPKYVNAANAGKKYGSIKDEQDNKYVVPANMVNQFQVGVPVDIQFENQTWGGEPVSVIISVGAQTSQQSAQVTLPPQIQPVPHNPPAQQVPHTPTQQSAPTLEDPTSENIFVTGIVGRAMGSGQFGSTDISLLAKAAVQAWRDRYILV